MISSKVRRNGSVDSDQLRSNPLLKKWYGQIHKEKFTPQLQAMLLSKLKGSVRVKMECFDRSRRKDSDRTEQTDSKAKRDFDLNLKHTKAQNSSKVYTSVFSERKHQILALTNKTWLLPQSVPKRRDEAEEGEEGNTRRNRSIGMQ